LDLVPISKADVITTMMRLITEGPDSYEYWRKMDGVTLLFLLD
jgi:hypothetical protein